MNIQKLIRVRHWVQWGFLALIVVFPFTGLFRMDAATGRFLVAGHQVWVDDFWVVLGAVGTIVFAASAFFYPLGQSFCGWMCPQHTISEFIGGLVRKLMGRRVLAGFDPERQAGKARAKGGKLIGAWALFITVVLAVSVGAALTIMHYFYTTEEMWRQLTDVGGNLLFWGFLVVVVWLFALDFGFFRHFWCKYMCMVGLYQYIFRGRDTLRIRFREEREDDCQRCTLCKDVCPMDLDPRQPEIYTRCINCGICIDACESYMGRFDKDRLLDFGFGNQQTELIRIETGGSPVKAPKVVWPLVGALVSLVMLVYGISTFSPVKLLLHQDRTVKVGAVGINYSAVVVNKGTEPVTFRVTVKDLPGEAVKLSHEEFTVPVGGQTTLPFRVAHNGLAYDKPYPFKLEIASLDGSQTFTAEETYFLPRM